MGAKNIYRTVVSLFEKIPESIELKKRIIAENIAIIRKKSIYNNVIWSEENQSKFDNFWTEISGKKISNRWHRLYESMSGNFAVDYFPEKLFSTKVEPTLNNYQYGRVLQDKNLLDTLSTGCGCVVPKMICMCSGGNFYDADRMLITLDEAIRLVFSSNNLIIKPTADSSSGEGISFIDNPQEMSKQELEKIFSKLGDNFVVQKRIIAHPDFAAFNSTSINTIRIITYITNGEMHHVPIAFRIGRKDKTVDNIHAGGLVVGVHDDGTLLPEAYELGYGDKTIKYKQHPDSGVVFDGYKLPCMQDIINSAYAVHRRLVNIGIVSWDYTVDDENNAVLIEANIRGQSIWFPQIVHGKGAFGEHIKEIIEMIK